jgi:PTH1 family peptidyl-tRNA hydrolase
MKLIIGLGNPGFRYRKTRHNAGFIALDYIQKNIGGFSKWKNEKKFAAEISKNTGLKIILAKPQTYMNNSGIAVKSLMAYGKWQIADLVVIHDDFDLPIGSFKLEKEKGSAGHKGVQSIINSLGTNSFQRLRIGTRPVNATKRPKADLSAEALAKAGDYVLKKFTREERAIIEKTIPEAINVLPLAISH